jgi:predicted metal-dependent peptidase
MADTQERFRMEGARLRFLEDHPYFSSTAMSIIFVESKNIPAIAGIDKYWRLYYNPDLTIKLNLEQLVGLFYHELLHPLREHYSRSLLSGASTDEELNIWNIAADCEINPDVAEFYDLPPKWCFPKKFKLPIHKSAEFYYHELLRNPDKVRKMLKRGSLDLDNGSGSDGQNKEWELGEVNEKNPGITEEDAEIIRIQTAQNLQSHRGELPQWADQYIKKTLKSKTDWRKLLSTVIKTAASTYTIGTSDYTYLKPSRRHNENIIFPSMVSPVLNLAVIVDTSGSMFWEEESLLGARTVRESSPLEIALSEVNGIIESMGASRSVHLLTVDAVLTEAKQIFRAPKSVTGGGGTDMRIGIEAAVKITPKPNLIILLTDGYTPWPAKYPGITTVVGLINGPNDDIPSWAKVVKIDLKNEK